MTETLGIAQAIINPEDIAAQCAEQTVCLYDGASIEHASELSTSLPEGIQVVVVPAISSAESVPASTIANAAKQSSGAETVILIEDRVTDRFVVVSDDPDFGVEVTKDLYQSGEYDGGLALTAISDTLSGETVTEPIGPLWSDSLGAFQTGISVVSGILVAAVVAGLVVWSVRRRRSPKAISMRREREFLAALDGEDGEFVEQAMETLGERSRMFPGLSEQITSLTKHVSDLFVRVKKRGREQQMRLLQSEYRNTLEKLLKAVHPDYLGDILQNPQYWSRPDERIREVQLAVTSVDQQALENIRQVNESRDLEFQVVLDSLIKTVDEAKLSDVYPDREN